MGDKVAHALRHEDTEVNLWSDSLHSDAVEICERLMDDWKGATLGDVQVSVISGGITNVLLKLKLLASGAQVMFRVFGDKTDALIDRQRELRVLRQLNTAGFGAMIEGTFANGRLEQFLLAHTLTSDDVRHSVLLPKIARRLAQFHAVLVDEDDKSPQLWRHCDTWVEMAKALQYSESKKADQFKTVDFAMIEKELREVRVLCDSTHSPVLYSHNDLLPGNIMALTHGEPFSPSEETELQFIDFEYGCYGFRGFDWGNHFNEWAGLECDYSLMPTLEQQEVFLRTYLETSAVRSVSPEQVAMAIAEANAFSLASHCFWGIWSLIQAEFSTIDFDFFEYSNMRFNEYHRRKQQVTELVLKQFPPPFGEPAEKPFPPAFPDADAADIPVMPPVSTAPVINGSMVAPPLRMD